MVTRREDDVEYEARREGKDKDPVAQRDLRELDQMKRDAAPQPSMQRFADVPSWGQLSGDQRTRAYDAVKGVNTMPDGGPPAQSPFYSSAPNEVVLGDVDSLPGGPTTYKDLQGGPGAPPTARFAEAPQWPSDAGAQGQMYGDLRDANPGAGMSEWDKLGPGGQQQAYGMMRGANGFGDLGTEGGSGDEWSRFTPPQQQQGYEMMAQMNGEWLPRMPEPDPTFDGQMRQAENAAYSPPPGGDVSAADRERYGYTHGGGSGGMLPDGSPAPYPAFMTQRERGPQRPSQLKQASSRAARPGYFANAQAAMQGKRQDIQRRMRD